MPIQNRIAEFHDDLTAWRRAFHAHPELALEEAWTSATVAEKLRSFGVDEVATGIARTGLVARIVGRDGGVSGRAIGIRADMDALPITEASGVPHASTLPGKMHACGHDGHTTMLLGAARYLAETRRFDGTVYCIFQPAEEHIGGGRIMVEEGLFERFPMDKVFGLHNWPSLPPGVFGWRDGPMMAATAEITITITGKGAHAAHPNSGIDPIVVAAAIVSAFQSVVSRTVDPTANAVLSVTTIHAGNAFNVIPETCVMTGTARWFDPAVGETLEHQVRTLATHVAAGFGATADIAYVRGYPATVNDPEAMALARAAAEQVVGQGNVVHLDQPTMGGEDFSYMLNAKQGAYIALGSAAPGENPQLHHPNYDFNDAILPTGASFWATLAERLLAA